MPIAPPTAEELKTLLGRPHCEVWNKLTAFIDANYDMEHLWNSGGAAWKYEYKYRRGGKTLCALYAGKNRIGFMVIFGKEERAKFEADREKFSTETQSVYDKAQTYRDGKWILFEPRDTALFGDFLKLLQIKRKPNRHKRREP